MRNIRNKFLRPRVLWDIALIEEEKALNAEYGLRRKKEIWAARSILRNFRERARILNATKNKDMENALLQRVEKLGLIPKGATLDAVLSMNLKNVLDRRLQTIIFKRGLAQTVNMSRQLITHGHIFVAGKKSSFPSLLVPVNEEDKVEVRDISAPPEIPKVAPVEIQEAEKSVEEITEDATEAAEEEPTEAEEEVAA